MKRFFLVLTCIACCSLLFSVEVNKAELESVSSSADTIQFINYEGPHKIINTKEEIEGIGSGLGKEILPSISEAKNIGNANTYYVIHAIDDSEKTGLNADIFVLGKNAGVDHIKNLRRIIAAYLTEAYGYSQSDAETIAVFITVYNAVYRSDLATFGSKYKKIVMQYLTEESAGISVNYKDWPGKTQLVIPLLNLENGNLSAIDTTIISDSNVIESMREEDERGVDERKNMVDIKEREADIASEVAKDAQKEATVAKQELEEAKEDLKQAEEEKQVAQEKLEEAKEEAKAEPENKAKQEAVKEAEKVASKAEEKAEQAATKVEEKTTKVEEKTQDASSAQAFADKKIIEAQTERTNIASDQQQNIKDAKAEERMTKAYGLHLVDDTNLYSQLVTFNAETGSVVKTSPIRTIRNRIIVDSGTAFAAVAGEKSATNANETIRLVLISKDTMEMIAQSNEDVSSNAMLAEDGNYLYTVIQSGNNYYLAKYSKDLRLQAQSQKAVNKNTPITVTNDGIAVTDSYGQIVLMSKSDLSVQTDPRSNLK